MIARARSPFSSAAPHIVSAQFSSAVKISRQPAIFKARRSLLGLRSVLPLSSDTFHVHGVKEIREGGRESSRCYCDRVRDRSTGNIQTTFLPPCISRESGEKTMNSKSRWSLRLTAYVGRYVCLSSASLKRIRGFRMGSAVQSEAHVFHVIIGTEMGIFPLASVNSNSGYCLDARKGENKIFSKLVRSRS